MYFGAQDSCVKATVDAYEGHRVNGRFSRIVLEGLVRVCDPLPSLRIACECPFIALSPQVTREKNDLP